MQSRLTLDLPNPESSDRLAGVLADHLGPGDAVLLDGPIGAGKSHLARAVIRARLGNPDEEVPSPTFTLVQTYDADPPIWHADLYRLSHPDEVMELGLDEAFRTAIALVEWPDRLGRDRPEAAIGVTLSHLGEGRRAEIVVPDRGPLRGALRAALRGLAGDMFLQREGWDGAARERVAGDASARGFWRLRRDTGSLILMDNPPGLPDRVEPFVQIAAHLRGLGISAPRVMAWDAAGFVLMEDLGDDRLADRLDAGAEPWMLRAAEVIAAMQAGPVPPGLPDLTATEWAEAALLCLTWYRRGILGEAGDPAPLAAALTKALDRAMGPKVFIHRDFFSGNLLILPRPGIAALGVVDFQLGQAGAQAYDLVSLLQDARRDLDGGIESRVKAAFAARIGAGPGFDRDYATWGAQRALRILGIFARLCLVEGKAGYLPHLPRVMRTLRRNLDHPDLAALRAVCNAMLPDPDAAAIERLRAQCGHFR